ncbi:MAG: Gfo/Idh/MocA family oxidoreductase [bacterium]|nr:Gfo/Idh/MocA family oxidoreductase [bacterium]
METRREFIAKASAIGYLTTNLFTGKVRGANDRLSFGHIGLGQQGQGLMSACLNGPRREVKAICDPFKPVLEMAESKIKKAERGGVKKYKDYRELLERKDIDAVVIATPDHWHAIITVNACKAGKDVYVEKPVSNRINEGYAMVKAARKYNKVVQVGTQQRSMRVFQNAVAIVQSGVLGEIYRVKAGIYGDGSIGHPPDILIPKTLDWDQWLGPSPMHKFNENRFGYELMANGYPKLTEKGGFTRWGTWRYFKDHGGGKVTDWGVHLLDVVLWAMNERGPIWADTEFAKYIIGDNREFPNDIRIKYGFPNFFCVFESMTENKGDWSKTKDGRDRSHGIEFLGTKGKLFVNRDYYETDLYSYKDAPPDRIFVGNYDDEYDSKKVPAQALRTQLPPDKESHFDNFENCIRTRSLPVSDIEVGNNSTVMCHLGNLSNKVGRIFWDHEKREVYPAVLPELINPQERFPWKLKV